MPIIRVEMWEGRSAEQKRELVDVFTRELVRICGGSADGVHVVIDEIKKVNWGIGGSLCSDLYPDKKP
jgi:4-oxalocrotonate tautomerase